MSSGATEDGGSGRGATSDQQRSILATQVLVAMMPEDSKPLRMAMDLFLAATELVPPLTPQDVLWVGTDVASHVFGRYAAKANAPIIGRSIPRLHGMGLAVVAGSAPRLARMCGYDPLLLSQGAGLIRGFWLRLIRSTRDKAQRARSGRAYRPLRDMILAEHTRAYVDRADWLVTRWNPTIASWRAGTATPDQDALVRLFGRWEHRFARDVRPTDEKIFHVLRKTAKGKKREDLITTAGEALSALALASLDDPDEPVDAMTLPYFYSSRGTVEVDSRGIIDREMSGCQQPLDAQFPGTVSLAGEREDGTVVDVSDQHSPGPPAAAAHAEYLSLVEDLEKALLAEARDEKDRRNILLMRSEKSCRRRAKLLGVTDVTLRKREQKMLGAAIAKAGGALREFILTRLSTGQPE